MTVTGKHKEILVELLIHYLANRYFNGNHKEINMASDYWVNKFIDAPTVLH